MNTNKFTNLISILVAFSVIVYILVALCCDNTLKFDCKSIWGNITTTITIVGFISVFFVSYAWKWKIFRKWLVPFPYLGGVWSGTIISTYEKLNKEIPIELKIKHNFLNINIKFKTEESASHNVSACFNIDDERDIKQLFYSYCNTPDADVREQSPIHYGTTMLEINDDANVLSGSYWTDRKTTGKIEIRRTKK